MNFLNLAHQHLLLNHWPIIGTFMGLSLFLIALTARKNYLKKVSLVIFSIVALFAIPAYTSGHAAASLIAAETEAFPGIVETHQGVALMAFLFMQATGAFAWLGLWQFRRDSRPAKWILPAVLFFSVVAAATLALTGNTGGEIRHLEIRPEQETLSFVAAAGTAIFASTQRIVLLPSRWGGTWPILETLHFLGLTLLFATLGLLDLRILGFFKQLPLRPLVRFVPWAIAGFACNLITGMLFFIGMPAFYNYNIDFHLKMFGVVLAGANILLLFCTDAFRECEQLGPNEDAPIAAKFFAATSMILVIAVLVLGRYMPFFEESLTPF